MKVSKFALDKLWEISDEYTSEGEKHRMVFDIKVENGDLISEDYVPVFVTNLFIILQKHTSYHTSVTNVNQ